MQKLNYFIIQILFLLCTSFVSAQAGFDARNKIKEQKEEFLRNLKALPNDPESIQSLSAYFETGVDNIYAAIINDSLLPAAEREKASRSLVYFISEMNKRLLKQKPDLFEIPIALQAYSVLLPALQNHYPLPLVMAPLSARCSQLMATAFFQYSEFPVIDDIAVYKRLASSPEFILKFLENNPGFRYADSLLMEAAVHEPEKMFYYLRSNKGGLKDKVSNKGNIYLQQMLTFSADKNASELFPFLAPLAEKSMNMQPVVKK